MGMDHSLLSVMKAVLNYAGAFELHYGISFVEARIKYIFDDMMPSRYLPKRSGWSYVLCMSFDLLMTRKPYVLTLLESPDERRKEDEELMISPLDREFLHGTQRSLVVL